MRKNLLNALVIALACAFACGCGENSVLNKNKPLYEQTIIRLQSGVLKPDEDGTVKLPPDLQVASVDGEIYVSRFSTNQIIVVFKTWRGKGNNMEGFLYAVPHVAKAAAKKDYYGKSVISIGPVELALEKQLDANWHKVSYKLD